MVVVRPTKAREMRRMRVKVHLYHSLLGTPVYVKGVTRKRPENATEQYHDQDPC